MNYKYNHKVQNKIFCEVLKHPRYLCNDILITLEHLHVLSMCFISQDDVSFSIMAKVLFLEDFKSSQLLYLTSKHIN